MHLGGLLIAVAAAAVIVPAGARGLIADGHTRVNYRGRELAFPLGAMVLGAAIAALAIAALLDARAGTELLDPGLGRWLPYLLGVAFLGLLDDSLGRGEAAGTPRGWRGHAQAVMGGRLSTGALKAAGSIALAAFVLADTGSWGMYVADVLLLALTTNLFNLLDLRGGRVEKALFLLVAGLCLGTWGTAPLWLAGVFLGSFLVGAGLTLRDRAMLGDTGSNLAGAVAGMLLIASLGESGRLIALAIVLGITILGEFRSLSKLIESFPPLRFIDSLARVK